MIALLLCIIYFTVALAATRRALWAGVAFVLLFGYTNGIVRANVAGIASQFMFDSSVVALYIGAFSKALPAWRARETNVMRSWMTALIAWVFLLFMIPQQSYLVQLIGVRSTVFYMLAVFIGLRMGSGDMVKIAVVLSVLNLLALAVGLLEFKLGVERFMPEGPTTRLIYLSNDVGVDRSLRIPSMFAHAAVYGGTMVAAGAFLMGALFKSDLDQKTRNLVVAGLFAAVFGIFLCAARSPAAVMLVAALYLLTIVRLGPGVMASITILFGSLAYLVASNERFQRFATLFDTKATTERLGEGANAGFFDLLAANPMGNGLGGSGTGIPYFLEDIFVPPELVMENEYARLVIDTGWIGLAIYIGFFGWCILRMRRLANDGWKVSRRLVWFTASFSFVTAFLGTGMLIALPCAFMLFFTLGWALSPPLREDAQTEHTPINRLPVMPITFHIDSPKPQPPAPS